MALGVRPWRVSMASLYVVCMAYVIYVAFIANVICVMWIVCGVCSGNSLSIILQFVDLFQVHLSVRERARLDGAACTLRQLF